MGYYNKLSLDTRTCGEADEDARQDARDGFGPRFTTVHRSAAWWREYNAEQRGRARGSVLELWKRGLTSSGATITTGYLADLERGGFVVCEADQ